MINWTQVYTPVAGSLTLSALVAALPVVVLLGLLAFGHVKAHWAALAGLAASLGVAIAVFGMPVKLAGAGPSWARPMVCFPSAGSFWAQSSFMTSPSNRAILRS